MKKLLKNYSPISWIVAFIFCCYSRVYTLLYNLFFFCTCKFCVVFLIYLLCFGCKVYTVLRFIRVECGAEEEVGVENSIICSYRYYVVKHV